MNFGGAYALQSIEPWHLYYRGFTWAAFAFLDQRQYKQCGIMHTLTGKVGVSLLW